MIMLLKNDSIITVQGLYKAYTGRREELLALRDINLEVYPGEFISCVGPSGCGKSTLLNILGGLLDRTAGEVRFKGQAHDEPRREIGMMFQTPVLFDWRTILDNVLLPVEILGLSKVQYRPRALELLDLVGLKGFETAYPRELSGGMQQRVALSRVLVYDPEVLLLDEPFGALDEFTREAMNLELLRIWDTTHKTVFFVTHNINEAVFLADRVVVMTPRPGQIARVCQIDLPRPRTRDVMRLPGYAEKVFEVREVLGVAH
jgi:NitT/TauT family transport system ATP-binding protein